MEIVNDPKISFISERDRKEGVSAFMRIRNGEDYLRETIESAINDVDEIICVFNNSFDRTEEILLELEEKYPSKIKVYKYIPIVYPPNSVKYLETPESSNQSLAYYYNFALSKTTYKYCFKMDDDELFLPGAIKYCHDYVRRRQAEAVPMFGINLYDFKDKLYLNAANLRTAGGDLLFFKYNQSCVFKKDEKYEVFVSNKRIAKGIDAFYHTKRCKRDRGINNYDLTEDGNKNSRYYNMNLKVFNDMQLIDFYSSDIYKKNKVCPKSLGFTFKGEKKYNLEVLNKLENKIRV